MRKRHLATIYVGFMAICLTPNLAGQRDVHAPLVASAHRRPAPEFHLMSDSGRTMQIADYRGKVVLLNFWATDCGGCKLELPSFVELEQAYGSKLFTAVGLSMDISYEDLKSADEAWRRVKPFIVNHRLNYPILMADESVFKAYGLEALPATFLIDKSGHIAATYVGIVSKSDVEANIKKLLTEQ